MRDQRPQLGVPVQGQQAADPGVLRVVLLPRRAAPPGHQVRVDRQHREPGVHEGLDQQPVAGFQHHPDLGRVRSKRQATGRSGPRPRPRARPGTARPPPFPASRARRHGTPPPSRSPPPAPHPPTASTVCAATGKTQRRADGPVLAGRHPCGRQAFAGARQGRRLTSVLTGQAPKALPEGDHLMKEGSAISGSRLPVGPIAPSGAVGPPPVGASNAAHVTRPADIRGAVLSRDSRTSLWADS